MVQFWKQSRKYNNLETNCLSQNYYSVIFEFYLNHCVTRELGLTKMSIWPFVRCQFVLYLEWSHLTQVDTNIKVQ